MRLSFIRKKAHCGPATGCFGGVMLQNIRDNSQSWISKTIIGLVVVLMAFTGFDAIVRATSTAQDAAKVNGDEITLTSLNQAVEMQRRQLARQLGKDFDASLLDDKLLREAALKGLIDRQLLLQAAQKNGLAFSQAGLDQVILQTPEFQLEGKFNTGRFDQVLQQMGYTRAQFRQMLEQEMLMGQLRAGFVATGFVTPNEVESFARLEQQTRDFASLTIKVEPGSIKVSDGDIKAYYEEHAKQYTSTEQVVLQYIELKKEGFFKQVKVKDADLQALYQKEIAGLSEQRRAAHILIEVNDKQSDAQAKAKIDALAAELKAGKDFAALAKFSSDDTASKDNGGDLGFAGPGVYEKGFEDALFALKAGEISVPVRTSYGWHLIKLLGVQPVDVPSFASLKAKLTRDYQAQQVEQLFVEASKQLESLAYESSDLEQPAQELNLKVQQTEPFGREGGQGLAANRQVLQAAFSSEVLEDGANSSLIELDPETAVVVRVKEHLQSKQLKLAQVREQITRELQNQRAAEQAKQQGEQQLTQLRAGETLKGWVEVKTAKRDQEGVDAQVLQEVFRMPKPAEKPSYATLVLNNGTVQVLRLDSVNEGQGVLSTDEQRNYRQFLASRSGQESFAAYRRQLNKDAKIERF